MGGGILCPVLESHPHFQVPIFQILNTIAVASVRVTLDKINAGFTFPDGLDVHVNRSNAPMCQHSAKFFPVEARIKAAFVTFEWERLTIGHSETELKSSNMTGESWSESLK